MLLQQIIEASAIDETIVWGVDKVFRNWLKNTRFFQYVILAFGGETIEKLGIC